jgi:hypothetical protein
MDLSAIGHIVQLIAPDNGDYGWNGQERDDESRDEAQERKLIFKQGQFDLQEVERIFHWRI